MLLRQYCPLTLNLGTEAALIMDPRLRARRCISLSRRLLLGREVAASGGCTEAGAAAPRDLTASSRQQLSSSPSTMSHIYTRASAHGGRHSRTERLCGPDPLPTPPSPPRPPPLPPRKPPRTEKKLAYHPSLISLLILLLKFVKIKL